MSQLSSNKRSLRRDRRRRRNRTTSLFVALFIIGAVTITGLLIWNSFSSPLLGEEFPPTGEGNHVPNGNPLPQFSTDPPTSGPHYVDPMPEGFYDEDSQEARFLPNPHGFIIHSMEHGYVVFWYNCTLVPEAECGALKTDIRRVMDEYDSYKIIAFPWTTTTAPVVATSWGYKLEMERWDPVLAAEFIETNRNNAPEPFAR
ncbi:MAG TPA: DUF3105 domain-containing protein [Anaerolineales bacterium]|nr:DUF3105 domain-containing protein [Anaerolineales bacterium]